MKSNKKILLEIKKLCVSITEKPENKKLIKSISFDIKKNEIVGLIGESGSGKSLTSLCILGLLEKKNGFLNTARAAVSPPRRRPEPTLDAGPSTSDSTMLSGLKYYMKAPWTGMIWAGKIVLIPLILLLVSFIIGNL